MGGLLSTRRPSEREWEIVLNKNLEWQEDGSQKELNYSVHLSYDDMSPELKQCFLYYSLFPKGSEFIEDIAISMWISEGFVQPDERSESGQLDLEEIGVEYHRELVARNLLEPDESAESGWVYVMHDVVRSFAQFVAREEALVVLKEQTDIRGLLSHNQKIRRLSMKLTDSVLEWNILEKLESLRTLVIACNFKPGGGYSLASFASLRALDISFADCDWLVGYLCQLRHLRYLSFTATDISRLPHDIHEMKFLEHIGLFNCTKLNKLPDRITKLGRLSLEKLVIDYAPSIELVGPEFQTLASGVGSGAIVTRPFPKLRMLELRGMSRWKKWEWEKEGKAMAMPALDNLSITCCMLTRLPSGLASSDRYNQRTLYLSELSMLASLENFPSVVELDVLYCPKLKKISGFSMLRKVTISDCPEPEVLVGVMGLRSMLLDDEPWEIFGTPARCTPKGYQAGPPRQLPQNLTIIR
ncbi:hypothetical protein ACQ4PT_068825 [Festuca glaucescens]